VVLAFSTALVSVVGLAQQDRTTGRAEVAQVDRNAPRHVVDSTGAAVGSLIDMNTAVLQVGDDWVAFVVGPSGFVGDNSDTLYYPSTDCSGTGYIANPLGNSFGSFFGYGAVGSDTLYYGLPSEASNVRANSARGFSNGILYGCSPWEDVNSRRPRAPVHTLPVHFTAPFRLVP